MIIISILEMRVLQEKGVYVQVWKELVKDSAVRIGHVGEQAEFPNHEKIAERRDSSESLTFPDQCSCASSCTKILTFVPQP